MIRLTPIPLHPDKSLPEYASEDCQSLLTAWEEFYPKIGFQMPWVGYFVWLNDKIIGTAAFVGAPVENTVEVSYWTFKEYEGKGIASQSCTALIEIAKKEIPEIRIIAKTAPEKNASTRVLEKNGFKYNRMVQDHEIGNAWEWKLGN